MQRRYTVTLKTLARDGSWHRVAHRAFRSPVSAERFGEQLNRRHCHATRYQRRVDAVVTLRDRVSGERCELDPVVVPSVGEIGWW